MGFAVPVLNYHGANIAGNSYAANDHVALAVDLDVLASSGWTIQPLSDLVECCLRGVEPPKMSAAVTFDDGTDFDFFDLQHPAHGTQRSMLNILRDHVLGCGEGGQRIHATSFVVVSPQARLELDRTSMIGSNWWNDSWWRPAISSGILGIASHSWDHNHDAISWRASDARRRGTFASVDNFDAAEGEIARAAEFLRRVAPNAAASLFAYPYGEANHYLAEEYFPLHHERIGVRAAFLSKGEPVTEGSNRWRLPRYTCGEHWKTPDELHSLLRSIAA